MDNNNNIFIKFKATFERDIRRFSFTQKPSYTEFLAKIYDIYQLNDSVDMHITYQDDTNDYISIANSLDLDESINFYKDVKFDILRLFITRKDKINNAGVQNIDNGRSQKNVGDLESLFVSLLSNQMIQQMIPQVINNLASNPALMTSIIQTTGNSLRNQNNLLNNTTTNDKRSPNTFHTQSTDSIVLGLERMNLLNNTNSIPNSPSKNTTVTTTTTTTPVLLNVTTNTSTTNNLKKSGSLESCNHMTTSSSSSSSSDITKSFEEIENTSTSPLSAQIQQIIQNENNNIIQNNNSKSEKQKSNPTILSQVPKIFQNIHFPFTSSSTSISTSASTSTSTATSNATSNATATTTTTADQQLKKDEEIQQTTVINQEYIPTQIYPINQPMPYSSPNFSYHLPQNISNSPVNVQSQQQQQQPLPLPQYLPPSPNSGRFQHTLVSTPQQTNNTNQPIILQQPPQLPQPSAPLNVLPLPVQQQQHQQEVLLTPNSKEYDEKIKFIQDALQLPLEKAKLLMEKYKGNVEEIFSQEQS